MSNQTFAKLVYAPIALALTAGAAACDHDSSGAKAPARGTAPHAEVLADAAAGAETSPADPAMAPAEAPLTTAPAAPATTAPPAAAGDTDRAAPAAAASPLPVDASDGAVAPPQDLAGAINTDISVSGKVVVIGGGACLPKALKLHYQSQKEVPDLAAAIRDDGSYTVLIPRARTYQALVYDAQGQFLGGVKALSLGVGKAADIPVDCMPSGAP